MQIGTMSKAERGYAPCRPQPNTAIGAAPVRLAKHGNVEQAFKAIASSCVAQVQANAAGVAHRYDGESLHQIRVGLRRLGAALDLFKDIVELPEDLQRDIDWLANELGNARDWDMLALVALQDELGKANDAVVEWRLLGHMANLRPDLAVAIAPVRGALAERRAGCDSKARKLWKRYSAVEPPR